MRDHGAGDDVSRTPGPRLSRRSLLVRGGALGISTTALTLLIACGGTSKAAPPAAPAPTMTMPMPTGTNAPRAASSVTATKASGSAVADTGGPQVGIDNFTFMPKSLAVSVGTTVTWTNRDDIPHTVTSRDKKFTSQALDTDERFTFTFTEPGTYAYFCAIHPIMTAEVIVK